MDTIRDALLQTANGRQVLVEVKSHKDAIAQRRQQVIDLILAGFPGRSDILAHARNIPATGEMIRAGGPAYDGLVTALKYASVDRRTALDRLGLLKK
jgi:hypothetical protein